uniref:C-type lectin domain-containing protein n=1 Tax=Panagrolaimus sp. ES5 TaxID=591445 RepID=A0AC34GV63_9BILA
MLIVFGIFLLIFTDAKACTCDGVEITQSDQKHCYQIIRNTGNSWVTADEKCSSVGGFLAHFNSTTLYNQLYDYISKNYELPLMTGATVANVELDLVALMCPSNVFYSLLSSSFVSSFFEGNPSSTDRCTFIVNKSTNMLQYMPCNTKGDILCDRPMENTNYCNIKMNCTATTTRPFSTTSLKTTTNSPIFSSTTARLTTANISSSSSSRTTSINPSSTTAVKLPTISSTSQSNFATQTTTGIQNTTSTFSTTTLTTTKLSSTTTPTPNSTVTTTQPIQTVTTSTTTVPAVITTTLPFSTSSPFYADTFPPPTGTSDSDSCGSGYTDIFGWCVPWWCWLIFGLLLLGLLLCCLSWLFHFCCAVCLCSHKKELPIEKNVERQWQREDAMCQTDPFVFPINNEAVYIPVPKTPPLPHEKAVIKERGEQPINTHTILHTHEIIHEKSLPEIPPPPPVIYDVTIYENAFNKNTILVPPIVHETQASPNIFLPPSNFEHYNALPQRRIPDDDIISANSIPFFPEDFKTPSPLPLYTKDESDPVPFLPVLAAPTVMPVMPLKPPKKKKERRPVSPLKHNRPPIGSQFDDEPKPKKPFPDNARDFPKPPPRDIETPKERAFPQPPPPRTSENRKTSPEKVPDEYFDRPVRKNTPLNLNRQPERLSVSPKPKERAPTMPRLPQRSPFEVPSPTDEFKPPKKKRVASPPITIFEPPNSLPQAPKPSNQRRLSPMHDEPPRLPSSPRKFSTPPPQKTFAADDISSKSISTPSSSSQRPRRRQSLDGRDTPSQKDVSMRAPRGRLGGANDKPDGWKPWAKNSQLFSGHPGFLDD